MKYLGHDYDNLVRFTNHYTLLCNDCGQHWYIMRSVKGYGDVKSVAQVIEVHSKWMKENNIKNTRVSCEEYKLKNDTGNKNQDN